MKHNLENDISIEFSYSTLNKESNQKQTIFLDINHSKKSTLRSKEPKVTLPFQAVAKLSTIEPWGGPVDIQTDKVLTWRITPLSKWLVIVVISHL